jgi:hypothetical protein
MADVPAPDPEWLTRLCRASSLALDAGEYADVPPAVEARVRDLCLSLPEVTENPTWAGTQWRIRKRIFAHVITLDFAGGPVTALTFRVPPAERDGLLAAGLPWFAPAWGKDAVGRVLLGEGEDDTGDDDAGAIDWDEVGELIAESYCTQAPKRLAVKVSAASGRDGRYTS